MTFINKDSVLEVFLELFNCGRPTPWPMTDFVMEKVELLQKNDLVEHYLAISAGPAHDDREVINSLNTFFFNRDKEMSQIQEPSMEKDKVSLRFTCPFGAHSAVECVMTLKPQQKELLLELFQRFGQENLCISRRTSDGIFLSFYSCPHERVHVERMVLKFVDPWASTIFWSSKHPYTLWYSTLSGESRIVLPRDLKHSIRVPRFIGPYFLQDNDLTGYCFSHPIFRYKRSK